MPLDLEGDRDRERDRDRALFVGLTILIPEIKAEMCDVWMTSRLYRQSADVIEDNQTERPAKLSTEQILVHVVFVQSLKNHFGDVSI